MKKELIEKIGATKFVRKKFVKKKVNEYRAEQKLIQSLLLGVKLQSNCSLHTISIFTWWSIRETGDLTLLLKEKRAVSPIESKCLAIIYTELQDEYIKVIGWSEEQKRAFELKMEIIECNKGILNGDDTQWTWLDIAEQELKGLEEGSPEKSNLFTLTASLEERLKIPINPYACSVVMFDAYLKRVKESNEQQE